MKLKLFEIAFCLLLGTARTASAQTFNYLTVDTDQFNAAVASLFVGAQRPITYGLSFQFSVQRVGQNFMATLLLADDTQYWTGWNRVNPHGNSLRLLESDSLADITSQLEALGAQFDAAGADWYPANFVAVPYGNKIRYFQLVAQD